MMRCLQVKDAQATLDKEQQLSDQLRKEISTIQTDAQKKVHRLLA